MTHPTGSALGVAGDGLFLGTSLPPRPSGLRAPLCRHRDSGEGASVGFPGGRPPRSLPPGWGHPRPGEGRTVMGEWRRIPLLPKTSDPGLPPRLLPAGTLLPTSRSCYSTRVPRAPTGALSRLRLFLPESPPGGLWVEHLPTGRPSRGAVVRAGIPVALQLGGDTSQRVLANDQGVRLTRPWERENEGA